jgi:hypothetical protein
LYGDLVSYLIFRELFDPATKTFRSDASTLDAVQKQALAILSSENDYIRHNVLMFALADAGGPTSDGALAYKHAVDHLQIAAINPDEQLRSIFGSGWRFSSSWRAILNTTGNGSAADAECAKAAVENEKCSRVPVANVLGVELKLPTPDLFEAREFLFPPLVLSLSRSRAEVAARLADYEALTWSVEGQTEVTREAIVRSILTAAR